jgi:hypothetical protein
MQTIQTRRVETHPTRLDLFPKKIIYHNHQNFEIGDRVDFITLRNLGGLSIQHNKNGVFKISEIHSNLCETIIEVGLVHNKTSVELHIVLT